MSIENIVLKKFIIKKKDLLKVINNKQTLFSEKDFIDYDDDDVILLDEFDAHYLKLITSEEYDMMSDYNSRTTLEGLKKYHWKDLVNTESDKGYWDITFRKSEENKEIEFAKFTDNDKVSSMIITEEEFVDLIDLVKRIS